MRITIYELGLDTYETINECLPSGWCSCVIDGIHAIVDVRLSNYTKFTTTGNGVELEYLGQSVIIDRVDFNYIKIE